MKLSYIGKRASSATTDKERFAEASTYEVDTDRKTCWVKVKVADYDEFIVIKGLYEEAKDAFRK